MTPPESGAGEGAEEPEEVDGGDVLVGLRSLPRSGQSVAGTANAAAVRLRAVRKRFGYRDVLSGVDLEVPRGACFVLTGVNGAGKSTVLRVISTQWTFSSGQVEVFGHDVRRAPLKVRGVLGGVFHESFLRRELTLTENLKFAADLRGLNWRDVEPAADMLLNALGLYRRRRDPVSTFSQGMTRRADLIRSLVHGPELWILDEPFAGLDAAACRLLEAMITGYVRGGRTVLLVTHHGEVGERLAGAGAVLDDGRVVDRWAREPADGAAAPALS